MTRIEYPSPLMPKVLYQYFLSTGLLSYIIAITFMPLACSISRSACPGCCSIRSSGGGWCLLSKRTWTEFCLIKVALASGNVTLCCLHLTEGSVSRRESNGSLVKRGAPAVRRQMRQGQCKARRWAGRGRASVNVITDGEKPSLLDSVSTIPCERSVTIQDIAEEGS